MSNQYWINLINQQKAKQKSKPIDWLSVSNTTNSLMYGSVALLIATVIYAKVVTKREI